MRAEVVQSLKQLHESSTGMAIGLAGINRDTAELITILEHTGDVEALSKVIPRLARALEIFSACMERFSEASNVFFDGDEDYDE